MLIHYKESFSHDIWKLEIEKDIAFSDFYWAPQDKDLASYCRAVQKNALYKQPFIIIISPYDTAEGEERWRVTLASATD
ncbi:MAG: hypothetical protein AB1Z19_03060 [Eubacteriales bacterium]